MTVALKEKAMISAEKHEQHQMLQMPCGLTSLLKDTHTHRLGLHSMEIKEYCVKKNEGTS